MTQISGKLVAEFQKIVKEEYGRDITMAEASEMANGLVGYFDTLAKIYHKMKTKEDKK
jgi:hypothetical protein